jgi:hypothetical protein
LITEYKNTTIEEAASTKFLGLYIKNHMNWKQYIDHILPQWSAAGFVMMNLFPVLNSVTLQIIYFDYFCSIIKYGVFSGGRGNQLIYTKFLNYKRE